MRLSITPLVLVGIFALAGCTAATPEPTVSPAEESVGCVGVEVVVNFGVLDEPTVTECIATAGAAEIAASEALDGAGVETEGTTEWGDQIVCRVNDRPAADETITVDGEAPYVEPCVSMPAAFAYWALWVKTAVGADWEYAQEGIGTLQLTPGESVGLVFTTGTETPTPSD